MATLTQTAHVARRSIKWTGILMVSYVVLRLAVVQAIALYNYLNPAPLPEPTVGFGPLDPIPFPEQEGYSYQFVLQTPNNNFPAFVDRLPVYYMPYQKASLLAVDEATALAQKIGFSSQPKALTSSLYEWRAQIPAPLIFTTNIVDGSFTLNYAWQSDPGMKTLPSVSDVQTALRTVNQYFSRLTLYHEDINYLTGGTSFWKAQGNRMVSAVSQSDADFVKVDYKRAAIEDYEVETMDPNQGIISVLVSGSPDSLKQFVDLKYNYFPVNYLSSETYPLKQVTIAWEELRKQRAYLALDQTAGELIYIRRVRLAYLDSFTPQQFLQPVYVFEGDDGTKNEFIAYVSAVENAWIKSGF